MEGIENFDWSNKRNSNVFYSLDQIAFNTFPAILQQQQQQQQQQKGG